MYILWCCNIGDFLLLGACVSVFSYTEDQPRLCMTVSAYRRRCIPTVGIGLNERNHCECEIYLPTLSVLLIIIWSKNISGR
jgi:hypothetical protein